MMVIVHEVYLSCKKGYCSNAKGIAPIQLNMADLPQFCAILVQDSSWTRTLKSFVNINHQ